MPDKFPPDDAMKTTSANTPTRDNSTENLSMGWLLPLLLLVLAAGLFFYFRNGSGNSAIGVPPQFIIPPTDTVVNKNDTIAIKKAPVSPDSSKR